MLQSDPLMVELFGIAIPSDAKYQHKRETFGRDQRECESTFEKASLRRHVTPERQMGMIHTVQHSSKSVVKTTHEFDVVCTVTTTTRP